MSIINQVFMTGRVVRDPRLENSPKGAPLCRVTIATNHKNDDPDQEAQETCYLDTTLWYEKAEEAARRLKKGDWLTLHGRLKLDLWKDKKTGEQRYKHTLISETVIYHANEDAAQEKIPSVAIEAPKQSYQQAQAPRAALHPRLKRDDFESAQRPNGSSRVSSADFEDLPF